MTYDKANEVIKEIFESLVLRYQIGLETSIKRKIFISIRFSYWITNATR